MEIKKLIKIAGVINTLSEENELFKKLLKSRDKAQGTQTEEAVQFLLENELKLLTKARLVELSPAIMMVLLVFILFLGFILNQTSYSPDLLYTLVLASSLIVLVVWMSKRFGDSLDETVTKYHFLRNETCGFWDQLTIHFDGILNFTSIEELVEQFKNLISTKVLLDKQSRNPKNSPYAHNVQFHIKILSSALKWFGVFDGNLTPLFKQAEKELEEELEAIELMPDYQI